jgi:hypothetical protein
MSSTTASNGSGAAGDATASAVDLHLVTSPRWCVLDADELLEQLVLAGFSG